MKIKYLLFAFLIFCIKNSFAQESNQGKQLWAKSVLNKKAPKLTVEKWLGSEPQTKEKFVLIDFWATWCGPCRNFIPTLNQWHQKFGDQVVIIGISDETEAKVKALSTEHPQYFEAIDTKSVMKSELAVVGIPHCILIDPDGVVRWEGFPNLENHELTEDILLGLINKYKK